MTHCLFPLETDWILLISTIDYISREEDITYCPRKDWTLLNTPFMYLLVHLSLQNIHVFPTMIQSEDNQYIFWTLHNNDNLIKTLVSRHIPSTPSCIFFGNLSFIILSYARECSRRIKALRYDWWPEDLRSLGIFSRWVTIYLIKQINAHNVSRTFLGVILLVLLVLTYWVTSA